MNQHKKADLLYNGSLLKVKVVEEFLLKSFVNS